MITRHTGFHRRFDPGFKAARQMIVAIALTAASLAGESPCAADTVNIVASRDNFLVEDTTGAWSGGAMPFAFAGNTNQESFEDTRRSLFHFDLHAVPLGSTITSASLRLYMSKSVLASTGTFTLHRVLADWGEGTSTGSGGPGGPSTPDSATWKHRFHPDVLWTNDGGDFARTASASLSVGGVNHYTWTSASLTADVQAWLDDRSTNFGWLLKGNEATALSAKRFDTRENAELTHRPTLIVNFTPPPIIGGCCLGNNLCVQASLAACTAQGGSYRGDGIACAPNFRCCATDINNDGQINVTDLLTVISRWGPCPAAPAACPGDVNASGFVNVTDLLAVISAWGPCQ